MQSALPRWALKACVCGRCASIRWQIAQSIRLQKMICPISTTRRLAPMTSPLSWSIHRKRRRMSRLGCSAVHRRGRAISSAFRTWWPRHSNIYQGSALRWPCDPMNHRCWTGSTFSARRSCAHPTRSGPGSFEPTCFPTNAVDFHRAMAIIVVDE